MTGIAVAATRLFSHLKAVLERKFREGNSPIQVWLDVDAVYGGFVQRLAQEDFCADVVGFQGSYIETLLALEAKLDGLDPRPLLLHLPGHTKDFVKQTPLLEAYEAGKVYLVHLVTLTREAAVGLVAPERIVSETASLRTFEEAERWLEQAADSTTVPPGVEAFDMPLDDFLYRLLSSPDSLLGSPLPPSEFARLLDYWALRTGLLPQTRATLEARYPHSLETMVVGWLLLMEYVFDLKRAPLGELAAVREQKAFVDVCKQCLTRVRDTFPEIYCRIALELEALDIVHADLEQGREDELGKIDTFSREDERLFEGAVKRLMLREWKQAEVWARQRLKGRSIWLKADPQRERLWAFVAACAGLGHLLDLQSGPLSAWNDHHDALQSYTTTLHEIDQAHRRLEQLYEVLQVHGNLKNDLRAALDVVRAAYQEWADHLARQFNTLCQKVGFLPATDLQQRNLYEQVVHPVVQKSDKVAYLLVDALRYEMAAELEQRLLAPELAASLNARYAELPTETPVGMNALVPVARDGKLTLKKAFEGFVYDNFVVSTPEQRFRAMGHRSLDAGKQKDRTPKRYTLKELLTGDSKAIAADIKKSHMIVVHSNELDVAGERDLGLATFDDTLGKLASAVRVLHNAGVQRFILTADHGFGISTKDTPPISYHNGQPTRRYVLAEGTAAASAETVVVSLRELGYLGVEGTLVLPIDTRAFASPGRNAVSFYHGGNSLQERLIPVLSLDYRERGRLAERPGYLIKAFVDEEMPHWKRLSLALVLDDTQMVLTEAGEQKVRLRLEAVGQGCTLQIESPGSAMLENGQLLVPTEKRVSDITIKLTGLAEAIRISHSDGEYEIAPITLPLLSFALPAAGNWEAALDDPIVLKILRHIDKHGQITESEIVELTDNTRAARRFAKSLTPDLLKTLPFKLRVDASQGTNYIKE